MVHVSDLQMLVHEDPKDQLAVLKIAELDFDAREVVVQQHWLVLLSTSAGAREPS
jgi:prolyl oligopeptidase PreP (S9A serine peptidase family)